IVFPEGQASPDTGYAETGNSPKAGESTHQKLGTQTPQKLGSHNRPMNTSYEQTTPPTPTAPVQQEQGPATAGEGLEEWIDLFPNSKRRNIRDARTKYAETINGRTTHQTLLHSTHHYRQHQQAI